MLRFTFWFGFALLLGPSVVFATDNRQNLQLTIYNSNLALVQEQRMIELKQGKQWLSLGGVSDQLIPESVRLSLPAGSGVLQQSFHHDPITLRRMLELHLGENIAISRLNPANGQASQRDITVLALEANRVTVRDAGKVTSLPISGDWRFIFPSLPASLTARPQLRSQIHARNAGTTRLGLRYLSSGLNWQANYDLNLHAEGDKADLSCRVSLHNTTTSHWPDARIELVAGQINRAAHAPKRYAGRQMAMMEDSVAGASPAAISSLGDYHLYSIPSRLSLNPGEQKQVQLFKLDRVPVAKHYRFDFSAGGGLYQRHYNPSAQFTSATVRLEIDNPNETGQALPAGLWRVFATDRKQTVRLLGEDNAGHTPTDRSVNLGLGKAFDITGKRTQVGFKRVDKKETLSDWKAVLKNAGNRALVVEVNERLGLNWSIVQQSHPHKRKDAQQAQWLIPVPAKGEVTLTYRVRVRQ